MRRRVQRDDARAARICQIIAATMGGKSLPLEDFMPLDIDADNQEEDAVGSVMLKFGDKVLQSHTQSLTEQDIAFRERMIAMIGAN